MKFPLDKLSYDERKAIEELRMRMKNSMKPNMYEDTLLFYRFLKARDFDVNKAEIMIRNNMIWRKLHQVDTILEDFKPKEFFRKYTEPSLIGYDKEGDALIYSPCGNIESKEILKCVKMNNYLKHWAWYSEQLSALEKKRNETTGGNFNCVSIIIDLDKLTFANATNKSSSDHLLIILNTLQDNYPESSKALYVINAPAYYLFIFTILKAIMSSVTLRKFHVFGYNGWKEKLLEIIDADILPAFLGGNRTDPDGDPLCKSSITHGGPVSPIYFISDEERYFKDRSRVKKISVPRMKNKEIILDVKEKGSLIHWEFYTKSKDIAFGLFYQVSEQEVKEIIPVHRYETSDGSQRDSYKTQYVGKYVFVFDNSYSWMISKEVEYCIEVMKPES